VQDLLEDCGGVIFVNGGSHNEVGEPQGIQTCELAYSAGLCHPLFPEVKVTLVYHAALTLQNKN
jgi:hypothetical protein